MNVIIVNDFAYINGGAGQIAIETAKELANQGVSVLLFAAVGPVMEELRSINNLEVKCLYQYDILDDPCRMRAVIQGLWNKKAKEEFRRTLEGFSPKNTVVHIHALTKALSSSIIQCAKILNFKIVYHVHDYGVVCPNMAFYNYVTDCICTRKAMTIDCITSNCDSRSYWHKLWRVLRQIFQIRFGGLLNNIDCYIFVSFFSFNILKPYIKSDANLRILPNFINFKLDERIKAENNENFIFIGRLSPEKNPQIVAQATKKLNIPITFIGDGICRDEIKKLNSSADITGWLTHKQMLKHLKNARALIFTSKCYETQGMAIIEALSFGIPVIVVDSCAGKDEIVSNKNGFVYRHGNLDDLIDKINKLRDDLLVKDMSEFAYKCYNNKYTSDNYIKRLTDIYSSIL